MICLQQDFDLHPASPRTRDAFVALARGIESAREKPQGIYTAAHLESAPGRMADFAKMLAGAGPHLPILASWRPVAGDPDLVIDLWKGDPEATDARTNAFMDPLREVAPNERTVRCFPMPDSPLR